MVTSESILKGSDIIIPAGKYEPTRFTVTYPEYMFLLEIEVEHSLDIDAYVMNLDSFKTWEHNQQAIRAGATDAKGWLPVVNMDISTEDEAGHTFISAAGPR